MFFGKWVKDIVAGDRTQFSIPVGRNKYIVGNDYAVQVRGDKPCVWWNPDTGEWLERDDGGGNPYYAEWCNSRDGNTPETLKERGFIPLRIVITSIESTTDDGMDMWTIHFDKVQP